MILSTMAVFFRDLEYLWSVGLMIIMYASAIFYNPETFKIRIWMDLKMKSVISLDPVTLDRQFLVCR